MISSISFGNKYVHEGSVFAKKEIEAAAETVAEAIRHDARVAKEYAKKAAEKYGYNRYDEPILNTPPADLGAEYARAHAISTDGKTLAIV